MIENKDKKDVEKLEQTQNLIDENKKLREKIIRLQLGKNERFHNEKLASIGQLSAGIAHEINNPLAFVSGNYNAILRYTKDIQNYCEKLEGLIRNGETQTKQADCNFVSKMNSFKKEFEIDYIFEDMKSIESETNEGIERIKSIISSLSDFARFDPLHTVQIFNLNEGLESTLNVVWNKVKYIAVVEKNYGNIPDIECVKNEINQVFLNIIMNAAQAIESQNRQKKGLIKLTTKYKEEVVIVEIFDNGPGIPKNLVSDIFNPFFTTKEIGKGTGLGLSISYDIIVNKHKGNISVDSHPDKGTTFIIELPVQFNVETED